MKTMPIKTVLTVDQEPPVLPWEKPRWRFTIRCADHGTVLQDSREQWTHDELVDIANKHLQEFHPRTWARYHADYTWPVVEPIPVLKGQP